jgi:2-polyprenyl-3-methyl-5-hydroxy-6-metoxy-1,4-benzoquinol methylase
MSKQHINYIFDQIGVLNPIHFKKLVKNRVFSDNAYYEVAEKFFDNYERYLLTEHQTLEYAIDCYLRMIADMYIETIEFHRTGKYTSQTFDEVNKRVYAKPETMEYYMHGLLMSQFLWRHHYQMLEYFLKSLNIYVDRVTSYLEIGAGHGLYISKATEILKTSTRFEVVDISETSINFGKRFISNKDVVFNQKNIFEYDSDIRFDFIIMGEVLEHVEDPFRLLKKVKDILNDDGTLFITTPTNAPAIDHIYLFKNEEEIRHLILSCGFEIISEKSFSSEDVSQEKIEKHKVSILYGAFIRVRK